MNDDEKEVKVTLKGLEICVFIGLIIFSVGFFAVLLQEIFGLVVMILGGVITTMFLRLYYRVKEKGISEVKRIKRI